MFKMLCKFTTDKGTLRGGAVVDKKELRKYFSQDEIDGYVDDGLILELEIPATNEAGDEPTLEELLDSDKQTLKVDYLKQVCEHYKLSTSGLKDDLIERIEAFETLLELDLEGMEESDVKQIASYYEVDTSLDIGAMIEAIEEASA